MLLLSWLGAIVACLGYGVSSVLQSVAAKRAAEVVGLTGIVLIIKQVPYLLGLAADTLAFRRQCAGPAAASVVPGAVNRRRQCRRHRGDREPSRRTPVVEGLDFPRDTRSRLSSALRDSGTDCRDADFAGRRLDHPAGLDSAAGRWAHRIPDEESRLRHRHVVRRRSWVQWSGSSLARHQRSRHLVVSAVRPAAVGDHRARRDRHWLLHRGAAA